MRRPALTRSRCRGTIGPHESSCVCTALGSLVPLDSSLVRSLQRRGAPAAFFLDSWANQPDSGMQHPPHEGIESRVSGPCPFILSSCKAEGARGSSPDSCMVVHARSGL